MTVVKRIVSKMIVRRPPILCAEVTPSSRDHCLHWTVLEVPSEKKRRKNTKTIGTSGRRSEKLRAIKN